ncbi:MAG TPA: hypothetical protein VKB79_11235 [Bryobacteraceae bacterium]|nr:hypothetical protein [Bryobacteraceae bacterium]
MTDEDRVRNLKTFGYTDREAGFLVQAALHSGYFLRRQFCAAIGRKLGKAPDAFISRLRNEKHVKEIDMRYRRRVYSLCSKVMFEALGEPDNRNRRSHDAQTIKARLMALDYVLGRTEMRWFPTEADKVQLFTEDFGIEKAHLPVWRYSSKDGKRTTLRWFVDRPLIFTAGSESTVHFCFVDPGYRTIEAFASFVRNYRPLFARLAASELTYLACFEGQIEPARRLFRRLITATTTPGDPIADELIAYFVDRKEHAANGLGCFDQNRLDRYRESRKRFQGTRFDELFERWKQLGESAVQADINPEARTEMRTNCTFTSHVVAFNFGLFGSLYEATQGD